MTSSVYGKVLTALFLCMLVLTCSVHVVVASGAVGVKTGDWIKYEYVFSEEIPSGTPFPQWMKVEFLSVEGTMATARMTLHFSSGTEQNQTVTGDIVNGQEFSGFLIPVDSTTGDSIYISGYGNVIIDGEITRTYAGAQRTVVYATFTVSGTEVTYYWDKLTGITVEASVNVSGINGAAKAVDTNMWQTTADQFRIGFVPSEINVDVGDVFTVNVTIADVSSTGLFSYEYKVYYTRTVLVATSAELPSDHFLKPVLTPTNLLIVDSGTINQSEGSVSFAITLLNPEKGKTGNGTLATITFTALAPGTSTLQIKGYTSPDPIFLDSNAEAYPTSAYTLESGYVTVVGQTPPPSGDIVVNFDDIALDPGEYRSLPGDYAGIIWDFNLTDYNGGHDGCWGAYNDPNYATPSSPPNYVFNDYGSVNPGFNFTSKIHFKGAYFMTAGADTKVSAVRFVGYVDGVAKYYSDWLTLSPVPTYLNANFAGVDRVVVEMQDAGWFTMDDLTYSTSSGVWDYTFSDSHGKGTVLNIDTKNGLFQFITPDKDYGVKTATNMQWGSTIAVGRITLMSGQGNILIWINHHDEELNLSALALDKVDYCWATAKDGAKSYFMMDEADFENTTSQDSNVVLTSWLIGDTPVENALSTQQVWQSFMCLQDCAVMLRTKMIARVLTVTLALRTDLNGDLVVNILDVTVVAKAFGSRLGDENWNQAADVSKDGVINIVDVTILAKDYGKKAFQTEFI